MPELAPITESQLEHQQRMIDEAVSQGNEGLRCILMSTANWLMIAADQLDDTGCYPSAASKEEARRCAELVIESLVCELPTDPRTLLDDVDPDDLIPNQEDAVESVRSQLVLILKGVRL